MWRDIQRRSMIYKITVPNVPVPYPLKDLDLANSVAVVGVEEGWILQYLEETYKLWFIDHNESGSKDNLNKSLLKLNLNPEEVIAKAKSSTIITKYNNNTAKAKINNVFAIGDCANSGFPPTAQVAYQQGEYLANRFNNNFNNNEFFSFFVS